MVDQFMGCTARRLNQLGSYNQQAAWFNQIGNAAFGFMSPVLAGFSASSISDPLEFDRWFCCWRIGKTSGGAGFLGALIGGF